MELPMSFNEGELWSRTIMLYNAALLEIGTKLEILNNEFKQAHQYNPIEHISSRIKSPQSIAKKMRHNGRELTVENVVKYINDIAGIRIICSFTNDIYRIADLIAKQSDITVLKVKDYIVKPKANGYTSYHMIVSVPIFLSDEVIDTKVEIQIRTIAMDFWASLEHKIYYKFEGNAPDHITRELKECADLVSFLDRKMLAINEEVQSYKEQEQEEGRSRYITNLLKDRMKAAYGTVVEEKAIVQEENEKEAEVYEQPEADASFQMPVGAAGADVNGFVSSKSGSDTVEEGEGSWRPVGEEGMLDVITEQVIKANERKPIFRRRAT